MSYDVWRSLHDGNFESDKYLYHYTNFDSAIKIIHSECFRFSTITKTNDTTESKLKISYDGVCDASDDIHETMSKFLENNIKLVRFLSFSTDVPIDYTDPALQQFLGEDHRRKYRDVSGRGFALPRMWAQYATNNGGVCFIVNKNNLEAKINEEVYCKHSTVNYKRFFETYKVSKEYLSEFSKKTKNAGAIAFEKMIQNDETFCKYSFFTKSIDWKGEHEYRYITVVDKIDKNVYVKGLFDYLEGIIVGENIDSAYKKVIQSLLKGDPQVMSIVFDSTGSTLREIT